MQSINWIKILHNNYFLLISNVYLTSLPLRYKKTQIAHKRSCFNFYKLLWLYTKFSIFSLLFCYSTFWCNYWLQVLSIAIRVRGCCQIVVFKIAFRKCHHFSSSLFHILSSFFLIKDRVVLNSHKGERRTTLFLMACKKSKIMVKKWRKSNAKLIK